MNPKIKYLGHAAFDLVISQSSYAELKWLSGYAERNILLSPLINHVIILGTAIP
jgi:hypothetical protein